MKAEKKLLFIINAHSGRGLIRNHLLEIINLFVRGGFEVVVYTTQGARSASSLVAAHGDEFDLVVVSGGDGTLNEAVSGILSGQVDVPLAYLPAGSTNDFGRSLGISQIPYHAAKQALFGREFWCDAGRFEDLDAPEHDPLGVSHFVYVAAFGAFADVSFETPQELKNVFGHSAYFMRAFRTLSELKPIRARLEFNGEVIEDDFISGMVTNSHFVGGVIQLDSRRISLSDGQFEITMIRNPKNPADLTQILVDLGQKNTSTSRMIYRAQVSGLKVISEEPILWTIDGEDGGVHKRVKLSNLHNAFRIFAPDENIDQLDPALGEEDEIDEADRFKEENE